MRKDIVRLNEVEKEIRTKTVQEESEEHALSVDEIFARADADLAKLDTISEQLKKESKKAKKQLNFFQRELRSFGLFVVIVILSIIVGIVYFVKTVLPEFSSEFKQSIVDTQEDLSNMDNAELSFEEYLYKKTLLGIDPESFDKSIGNIDEISKYAEIVKKLETEHGSVDLSKLTEEEKQEFDEFYQKYQENKKKEELKKQLSEELHNKMLEEK